MSNSLADIIARLKQGPATLGWGAILSFGRDELNRMIKNQYLSGFEGFSFLLPFTELFPVNDDKTEQMELRGIVLGGPMLSFESASLNGPALTVTLNIINGSCTRFRHGAGVPPTVLSSFNITEDMGFHVRMQASIQEFRGEVDKHGIVAMDLTAGDTFVCNLSSVKKVQEIIGEYFRRYFVGEEDQRRRFVLARVDLNQYNPLCPTRIAVRVHRAPGAEDPLGDNFGDGAVVVFCMLKVQGNDPLPGTPSQGSNFPYLIPDDLHDGAAAYTASVLVKHDLLEFVEADHIDLLASLVFPNDNEFDEAERHHPYDLAIFGKLGPSARTVTITPSSVTLTAKKTQQFTAVRGDGTTVAGVQWTVSSPDIPSRVGSSIPPNGLYTASDQASMHRYRLPLVVSATYAQDGEIKVASALVQERFQSMEIAPLVQIQNGSNQTPITLHGSTLGEGPLHFDILEPKRGARLEPVDANTQTYFPPPTVQPEPILVQKIQLRDQDSGDQLQASIILINAIELFLQIDPYYKTDVRPGESVPLLITNAGIAPGMVEWSVIGEGEIIDEAFVVPESPASMISVVVARFPSPAPAYPDLYGYSIINLQPVQLEYIPIRWERLASFKLSAPDTPGTPGVLPMAYANGLQQIPILIEVITNSVKYEGQDLYIPVSDVELSKLRFVEKTSGALVPFIDELQDGLDYDSSSPYAAHVRANRFSLYSSGTLRRTGRAIPSPRNEGTRYRMLYLHMAVGGSRTFYAEFQSDAGQWCISNSTGEGGSGLEGEITVQGILPPVLTHDDYNLSRERAYSDPSGMIGPPLPERPDTPDYFSYFRESVDYWTLQYKRLNTYSTYFVQLSVEGNVSTIQWESEFLEETFFSYTGYAFQPYRFRGDDTKSDKLTFDIDYRRLLKTVSPDLTIDTALQEGMKPANGELIISLHRVPDMPFWHDGKAGGDEKKMFRKLLDRPLILVLVDQEGNRHRVQVKFPSASESDSRNALVVSRL